MEMKVERLEDDVTRIVLVGRLDIQGAQQIDLQFSAVTNGPKRIVVDVEQVSFLASMGIRTLILGAKAVSSKGGRMVLLKPNTDVEKVLVGSGTDTVIPIFRDISSALAAMSA